jgi:hypothetical protein
MKKKRIFFAGLAALFVATIIGFVGCKLEPTTYDYEFFFRNRSSYTIQVDIGSGYDVHPNFFTISPGKDKKCGGNTNYTDSNPFYFYWHRTDTGNDTGIRWDRDAMTFYNR